VDIVRPRLGRREEDDGMRDQGSRKQEDNTISRAARRKYEARSLRPRKLGNEYESEALSCSHRDPRWGATAIGGTKS